MTGEPASIDPVLGIATGIQPRYVNERHVTTTTFARSTNTPGSRARPEWGVTKHQTRSVSRDDRVLCRTKRDMCRAYMTAKNREKKNVSNILLKITFVKEGNDSSHYDTKLWAWDTSYCILHCVQKN